MTGYISFYIYLIMAIASILYAGIAVVKRAYDAVPPMPIIFLCSMIGLATNYDEWLRVFAGIYGIVLNG